MTALLKKERHPFADALLDAGADPNLAVVYSSTMEHTDLLKVICFVVLDVFFVSPGSYLNNISVGPTMLPTGVGAGYC
jgi:hypothetical protein